MDKIKLEIITLSHSVTRSQSYAIVLGEMNGRRRLPIVIGGFEAQAIAVALEDMEPPRPLTHDLMKNIFSQFDIVIDEIIINELKNGVFFSQLICSFQGEQFEIDSRTSDAIALAVRYNCPIYTYEFILESAGIILEDQGLEDELSALDMDEDAESEAEEVVAAVQEMVEDVSDSTIEELERLLADAIKNEDYERAARIRDEIKKKK